MSFVSTNSSVSNKTSSGTAANPGCQFGSLSLHHGMMIGIANAPCGAEHYLEDHVGGGPQMGAFETGGLHDNTDTSIPDYDKCTRGV
jgi:hypothetical protein